MLRAQQHPCLQCRAWNGLGRPAIRNLSAYKRGPHKIGLKAVKRGGG